MRATQENVPAGAEFLLSGSVCRDFQDGGPKLGDLDPCTACLEFTSLF